MANARPIRTDYFFRGKVVMQTRGTRVDLANRNAFHHMQLNDYGATSCQVLHNETGKLYTEFVRPIGGKLDTSFKENPRDFVTPGTLQSMKKLRLIK